MATGRPRSASGARPQSTPRGSSRTQDARASKLLVPGDAEWPDQVGALRDAGGVHDRGGEPVGLWVRGAGDLRQATANSVAVVGSRAATSRRPGSARERISAEISHPWDRPSSVARPTASIRPLYAVGSSPAVPRSPCFRGGADRAYPAAHAELLDTIAQHGLVVSECPPGTSPTRARFLARDRITAALAEGTAGRRGRGPKRGPWTRPLDPQRPQAGHGHARTGHQRGLRGRATS